jgi:glycosyltransferase involved in cell wall biosynthesis
MERVLADLIGGLDPSRFDSHVLVLQYVGRFGRDLAGKATIHQAPPQGRASLLWPRRLAAAIGRIAPDVVHTHSGVWFKAVRAARSARVGRVVHTEHGRHVPDPLLARVLDRAASRKTDVVVAVSNALRHVLIREIGVSPNVVRVVPNGVRAREAVGSGAEFRARYAIPADAPLVVSVGRLEPVKGYDILLAAFARTLASWSGGPRPCLLVAGDGSGRARLQGRAVALGVDASIRFPGWIDDVGGVLAEADVFTLASRSEGTSVSLLEAMAAGVCPVVTDVGGNADVLGPELAHRLCRPGDPDALGAALLGALEADGARSRDAVAARARALGRFGLDAMVDRYAAIYRGEDS